MIGKGICLLAVLLLIPFMSGTVITGSGKHKKESVIENWVTGFLLALGLAEIVVVPATFLELSFQTACLAYGILMAAVTVFGVMCHGRQMVGMVKDSWKSIGKTPAIAWLVLALMMGQMFLSVYFMYENSDDAFYVATSVTAMEENSLFQVDPYTGDAYNNLPTRYVLSPFPIFTAMVSRYTGIHPARMAHTLLPAVLLLLVYGSYTMIGRELFEGSREKTGWMVFFAALYLCFSAYTTSTQGSMILRLWQGKAVLATALLPMIFYEFLRFLKEKEERSDWLLTFFIMMSCCLVSSMGIMLGAILLGCCGLVVAAYRRKVGMLCKMAACAAPNLVLAVLYVLIR